MRHWHNWFLRVSVAIAWECQMFYKRLSETLAEKRKSNASLVTSLVRTKISMSLLRTAILCIRGSHPQRQGTVVNVADTHIKVAYVKAGIEH